MGFKIALIVIGILSMIGYCFADLKYNIPSLNGLQKSKDNILFSVFNTGPNGENLPLWWWFGLFIYMILGIAK